jgi:SAM-dependent methyltransferase
MSDVMAQARMDQTNSPTFDLTGTPCVVCHSKRIHYDFSVGRHRVEECTNCGLMRLNPQPSDAELAQIYGATYFAFSGDAEGQQHASTLKARTADYYLDQLESYAGGKLSGTLLEVGSGHGDFLMRAAARGLVATGVEYSEDAVKISTAKLGDRARVIQGELAGLLDAAERYDFVVFADVLEHVRDPRLFLRKVHALLKDDGVLVAVVPSLDSVSARWMKTKWVEFKREHLWYFSLRTISQLLYDEAFGCVRTTPAKKSLSYDYIAQHFEHYPVRPYSSLVRMGGSFIPLWLRRKPVRITASGICVFARKELQQARKKLSIVMPAFNEAGSVRQGIERVLAKQLDELDIELIIVESNSTDGTREIVREYEGRNGVKVILEDRPEGKGHAVRQGFLHVTGDYVMIQDADNEYDIEDYDALIRPLAAGEATFVLGARHGGGAWKMRQFEDQPFAAAFLNFGHWLFTTLVNVVYGLRLRDPFTMYKVFRSDCLRGLTFECNRFDFDYELLIKLVRRGYRPVEIPVNYRSRSFKEGKKVNALRDPLTWLRAIVKFRFQKL